MARSMTGFGRGEYRNEFYGFKIEIKTVNHRYNDISVKMPRHISYLEDKIKNIVKGKIARGKVDIYINMEYIADSYTDIKVDIELAKSYKSALENLADQLGLDDHIKLSNILNISEIVKTERKDVDEDMVWDVLHPALDMALLDIIDMKSIEGKTLAEDMNLKLKEISSLLLNIEKRSPIVVEEYRGKLEDRIKNLIGEEIGIDEEKIAYEVVFFADKSNIDEEVVRLKSHIDQFRNILKDKGTIGRKLDFLIQEMNREINTIGSKSADTLISQNVVEVKAEIEKIREQVQNIE